MQSPTPTAPGTPLKDSRQCTEPMLAVSQWKPYRDAVVVVVVVVVVIVVVVVVIVVIVLFAVEAPLHGRQPY